MVRTLFEALELMARTFHARKRKPLHPAERRLEQIRALLEAVDTRAVMLDHSFRYEITPAQIRELYRLSGAERKATP